MEDVEGFVFFFDYGGEGGFGVFRVKGYLQIMFSFNVLYVEGYIQRTLGVRGFIG